MSEVHCDNEVSATHLLTLPPKRLSAPPPSTPATTPGDAGMDTGRVAGTPHALSQGQGPGTGECLQLLPEPPLSDIK